MTVAVLLLATVGGLSGCGDTKTPSNEAFATALEPVVCDVFCHPIDVMRYKVEGESGESGFPIVTLKSTADPKFLFFTYDRWPDGTTMILIRDTGRVVRRGHMFSEMVA